MNHAISSVTPPTPKKGYQAVLYGDLSDDMPTKRRFVIPEYSGRWTPVNEEMLSAVLRGLDNL